METRLEECQSPPGELQWLLQGLEQQDLIACQVLGPTGKSKGKECLLNFARQQNIGEGALTRELRNVGSGPSSAADSEAGKSPPLSAT